MEKGFYNCHLIAFRSTIRWKYFHIEKSQIKNLEYRCKFSFSLFSFFHSLLRICVFLEKSFSKWIDGSPTCKDKEKETQTQIGSQIKLNFIMLFLQLQIVSAVRQIGCCSWIYCQCKIKDLSCSLRLLLQLFT